jgi:hypothetical protein
MKTEEQFMNQEERKAGKELANLRARNPEKHDLELEFRFPAFLLS